MCSDRAQTVVYDLVGLGFGPANIAMAGALLEKWEPLAETGKKFLFLEKHDKFRWHPGMLLPGVRMQNSYLKDLATFRNPQSPLTFLSYLHKHNRMSEFVNRGSNAPTRKEYSDYLAWGARQVIDKGILVHYSSEVVEISKGPENTLQIYTKNPATGEQNVYFARDLIISPGGSPRFPQVFNGLIPHPQVMHSIQYGYAIDKALGAVTGSGPRPLRVGVVGSGQSASETALDVRQRLAAFPTGGDGEHIVDIIISRGAPIPADDTPFVNEIFDASVTDPWYHSSERSRGIQLKEFRNTNYGVNSHSTLMELFEIAYDQKLDDAAAARDGLKAKLDMPRLNYRNYTTVLSAQIPEAGKPISLVIRHALSNSISETQYDVIICATGFERSSWVKLFRHTDLASHYGVHECTTEIELVPELVPDRAEDQESVASTPSELSSIGTPLTSPEHSVIDAGKLEADLRKAKVQVSRAYQLIPTQKALADGFKPRVYVQGLEEASHGISDTLLSVIGIRAGEIVDNLYA